MAAVMALPPPTLLSMPSTNSSNDIPDDVVVVVVVVVVVGLRHVLELLAAAVDNALVDVAITTSLSLHSILLNFIIISQSFKRSREVEPDQAHYEL